MFDTISKEDVERICLETMRNTLNEHEYVKAELNLYKTGQVVPLPVDKEHAKCMLIIAMNYLGINPGDPITLTKEKNA